MSRAVIVASTLLASLAPKLAAADEPTHRLQVGTGVEYASTTRTINDNFLGPYLRAAYRPSSLLSLGVVGGYGAIGTSVGDDVECSSGATRHLWQVTGEARAHSRVAFPLEVWAGAEAGVAVLHSLYTESCPAGIAGGPFTRSSPLDQVAPILGPALGASVFLGRYVSLDITTRGWLAVFGADSRPGAEDLGTRFVIAIGLGVSVHVLP
jgi:hypothetical protein